MVDKPTLLHVLAGHSTINQRYVNCAPLPNGAGGNFSVVCSADHKASGKKVALKFHAGGPDQYRRACFDREGRLLAKLMGQPMVVQLVEPPDVLSFTLVGTVNGQPVQIPFSVPFLPLEWMSGGHLGGQVSPKTTRVEFIRTLKLFRETCKAVRRLHVLQIFHRDLKPENFLLVSPVSVCVSDLGTARLVAPNEAPLLSNYAGPVGDLRYTAPEMLAGIYDDPALFPGADLYSLGIILFELLTGMQLQAFGINSLQKTHQFVQVMGAVPTAGRRALFEKFLDGQTFACPDLWTVNPALPKTCREVLVRLVEGLARFDYRRRLTDWDDIFRLLEICIRATENEEAYLRMLARRRR